MSCFKHHDHEHDHHHREGGHRFMRGRERPEERHLGGHEHFGRHGRGRHRVFDQGDLRLVILHLIAERPRHGYELIKAIEDQLAGTYSPSPGVIYPTLTMLEEMGLVALGESEGARKLYAITEEGRAHLHASKPALDAILARMAELSARESATPTQLLRAMENLKLALRLRLGRGALTEDEARALAAVLDGAATEIDRI